MDQEVSAAVTATIFATYDGLFSRLRTLVAQFREGADNLQVIKALLDMTIPKDSSTCEFASFLQFLALSDHTRSALITGLFKDRRACLLLLLSGTITKALQADDVLSIQKGPDGYTVTRLDGAPASVAAAPAARRVAERSGAVRTVQGERPQRRSEPRHSEPRHSEPRGGGNQRKDARGEFRGSYRGSPRGNHRGGRGAPRADAPFPMNPDWVKEMLENAEKEIREGRVEEYPLPTRSGTARTARTARTSDTIAASVGDAAAGDAAEPSEPERWGDISDDDGFFA